MLGIIQMTGFEFLSFSSLASGNNFPVYGVILHGTVRAGLSDGQ
jgi:hypothetical protein